MSNHTPIGLHIGQRVQLAPHLDAWMMGDRYGEIVTLPVRRTPHNRVGVKMDRSGRVRKVRPDNLTPVS
jgi:hypothetical protein